MFSACSSLTSINLSNSATTIGKEAFFNCANLNSIIIPNSVITIENRAFALCSALKEITLSTSLKSIGDSAFYSCSSLADLTIPNSVKTIRPRAFQNCSRLKELTIDCNFPTGSFSSTFGNCPIETIYVRQKSDYENLDFIPGAATVIELAMKDFSLCKEGFGTVYSQYPFVVPSDCQAGIITGASGNTLDVNYVYQAGDIVPSETAVLIKGKASETITTVPMEYPNSYEGIQPAPEGNLLYGSVEDIQMTPDASSYFYKLSYNPSGTDIGFYWGAANGAAFENPANKAYLKLPKTLAASTKRFLLEGSTTGIDAIDNGLLTMDNETIYDLSGRKVLAPAKGGVYIKNGKKFMVK